MSLEHLRILHVTPYNEPAYLHGGPARSVPLLCQALVRAGADVTVLTTDSNGPLKLDIPLAVPLTRQGVEVYYFHARRPRTWFYSPDLAQACRQLIGEYDLVHITGLWTHPGKPASSVSLAHGKPYIISPRGMLMAWELSFKSWKKRPYYRAIEYRQLEHSSGLHCTTYSELDDLAPLGLASSAFVVPNGIDMMEFEQLPPRGSLRSQRKYRQRDVSVTRRSGADQCHGGARYSSRQVRIRRRCSRQRHAH